jgi:hypothetical protein
MLRRREAGLLGEARVAVADQGVLGRLGDRAAARLVRVNVRVRARIRVRVRVRVKVTVSVRLG